jgi:hypothetical protein
MQAYWDGQYTRRDRRIRFTVGPGESTIQRDTIDVEID